VLLKSSQEWILGAMGINFARALAMKKTISPTFVMVGVIENIVILFLNDSS
jgi:hypothetical protein